MRAQQRRGMTLVEVLIAVSLVSLLSLGLLYAMRAGLQAMSVVNARVEANRRAGGAERVLELQFSGFLPVMARCGAGAGGMMPPATPFFQGEPQVLRFVTTYSLFGGVRGTASIVEYFLTANPEGGVRLLVNEIPYRGPVGAGLFCGPPVSLGPGLPPLPQPLSAIAVARNNARREVVARIVIGTSWLCRSRAHGARADQARLRLAALPRPDFPFDHFGEFVDVLEAAVHRREADVGHLVEPLEFTHHEFAQLVALDLALRQRQQLFLDAADGVIDASRGTGRLRSARVIDERSLSRSYSARLPPRLMIEGIASSTRS